MNYRQFEHIFFSLALTIILATMLVSMASQSSLSEILGQALVVPIVYASLHYGRQRGLLMAFLATLAFILIKVNEGLQPVSLIDINKTYPIFLRAIIFGIVGVFFGELAARAKYLLYRLENQKHIDAVSSVYSRYHLENLIKSFRYEYERYHHPFSVLVFELSWLASGTTLPSGSEIKAKTGLFFKKNIRGVDEAGNWDGNTFLVLMPHTVKKGALKAANRLAFLAEQYFKNSFSGKGVKVNVKTTVLTFPEEELTINAMLENTEFNVVPLERQKLTSQTLPNS